MLVLVQLALLFDYTSATTSRASTPPPHMIPRIAPMVSNKRSIMFATNDSVSVGDANAGSYHIAGTR